MEEKLKVQAKKKIVFEAKVPMKTYSFKMSEAQYEIANGKCQEKYGTSLPTIIRELIKSHFEIK